ncbi:MAG: hypothetical protein KH082_00900, partial [Bifidobacterium longum]|nr:hypothetical protein [Bifidobacterium longum]
TIDARTGTESHRCAETDASDSRQPINDSRQMASGSRLPATASFLSIVVIINLPRIITRGNFDSRLSW